MKNYLSHFLALLMGFSVVQSARAQTTAFTYQGVLKINGATPTGNYDFQFRLYDTAAGTGAFGQWGPFLNVPVASGLFTLPVDMGSVVFAGCGPRYLEIDFRASGTTTFTTLAPRTPLTPAPYAISAYTACSVQNNGVSGSAIAPGQVVKSLDGLTDAVTLTPGVNVTFVTNGNNIQISATGGGGGCSPWCLTGNGGTTPGLDFLGTTDNQALTLKVNNMTALQIRPAPTLPNIVAGLSAFHPSIVDVNASGIVIAGGMAPSGAVSGLGGGDFMAAYDDDATIGGGFGNKVGTDNGDTTDAAFATVAGGVFNGAAGYAATIAGGDANLSSGSRSFVGGGYGNEATGDLSTLGGGRANRCSGNSATIGGGSNNVSAAIGATVPGGLENAALGLFSFAAGQRALATNNGAFVWADSQSCFFTSITNDEFCARAGGGVRFASGCSGGSQTVIWRPGSAAWSFSSDRNAKENLQPVDGSAVLDAVSRLPLMEWNYIGFEQRHLGPMAQDFHAAFPWSGDDRTLNTADLHGVSLAAIQALNQKLKDKDATIDALQRRLERLEAIVSSTQDGNSN